MSQSVNTFKSLLPNTKETYPKDKPKAKKRCGKCKNCKCAKELKN